MARPRTSRHISFRLADKEAIARLERLDEPLSEFMRDLLLDYFAGRLVKRGAELRPLDAAKLKGIEIDNKIKQKRLDDYGDLTDLKRRKLLAEIEAAQARTKITNVALSKMLAPVGDDGYRYLLAEDDGTHRFFCPICGKTIVKGDSYTPAQYTLNKMRLVNHMADVHGIMPPQFERATLGFFSRFELRFFGQSIDPCPIWAEYCDGELLPTQNQKELPAP